MGAVGVLALLANVGVALMLFRFRSGDASRCWVWICSSNDAIGNVAVLAAAVGVFGTGSPWPACWSRAASERSAYAAGGRSRGTRSPSSAKDAP